MPYGTERTTRVQMEQCFDLNDRLCCLQPFSVADPILTLLAGGTRFLECLLLISMDRCSWSHSIFPRQILMRWQATWIRLLTIRQPAATLILSSVWNVPVLSCMFPSLLCVVVSCFFVRWHCWCWIPIKETLQYDHASFHCAACFSTLIIKYLGDNVREHLWFTTEFDHNFRDRNNSFCPMGCGRWESSERAISFPFVLFFSRLNLVSVGRQKET